MNAFIVKVLDDSRDDAEPTAVDLLVRVSEEDLVQDVWLRWRMLDRRLVRDAAAFFTTTTA